MYINYIFQDFPNGEYDSGGANVILYIGLGMVAMGLVITFVGLGDKVSFFGSSPLSLLMLDLGVVKIISEGVFLFLAPTGGSNHEEPDSNYFPNPARLG